MREPLTPIKPKYYDIPEDESFDDKLSRIERTFEDLIIEMSMVSNSQCLKVVCRSMPLVTLVNMTLRELRDNYKNGSVRPGMVVENLP